MFSGTGTKGSEAELGSKRRRLDPKSKVQGHLDGRFEMGLPILGPASPNLEAQQDSSADIGRSLDFAETDGTP